MIYSFAEVVKLVYMSVSKVNPKMGCKFESLLHIFAISK